MKKILKPLSISLVLMYMHLNTGNSELITLPHDTEVLVNQSTYFNCSTSIVSEQIHWYHYHVRENKMNYVYYKGQFNQIYSDRYSVAIDTGTGKYDLIIRSVQPGDAGRYVCQDDGGLGSQGSAELIVLDHGPVCQSSMEPGGLVGPNSCALSIDELQLSCSLSYSGNIHPALQWKIDGSDTPISDGITIDNSVKAVTVNLTKSPEVELDHASFTCGTNGSRGRISSCTSGQVKVNYAIQKPEILNVTKGETVTCSANASVSCIYRWFYGNDTLCPASCNEVLTTSRLGDHSCEASCTIDSISCSFVTMRIFVYENETTSVSEDTIKRMQLLLLILIPTVVVLLIVSIVLFFIIRKVKSENSVLKVQNDKLTMYKQGNRDKDEASNDDKRQNDTEDTPVSSRFETISLHEKVEENRMTRTTDKANYDGNRAIGRNAPFGPRDQFETQPLLKDGNNTVQSWQEKPIITKASNDMGRAITGVAILEDLLYIVSDKSSEVETFDSESLEFKNRCKLDELESPWDMVSCKLNKCLYIMDRRSAGKSNHVIRVDSEAKALVRWSTEKEYGNLSVTRGGHVIVTFCDSRRLFTYESDGTRLNVVSLSEDIIHPSHALKLNSGQFLISYGCNDDNVHRVCVLDENGEFLKNSFEALETPGYLAVDKDGVVFVGDQGNSRVCAFNSDLELIKEVALKKHGLRSPQKFCLDEKSRKLFIADNEVLAFRRRYGRLITFSYEL